MAGMRQSQQGCNVSVRPRGRDQGLLVQRVGSRFGEASQHVAYAVPETERNESGCQLVGLRDLVLVTLLVFNGQNRMDPD